MMTLYLLGSRQRNLRKRGERATVKGWAVVAALAGFAALIFIPQSGDPFVSIVSAAVATGSPEFPLSTAQNRMASRVSNQAFDSYGQLPMSFEPNADQTDARVKFVSRGRGYTL